MLRAIGIVLLGAAIGVGAVLFVRHVARPAASEAPAVASVERGEPIAPSLSPDAAPADTSDEWIRAARRSPADALRSIATLDSFARRSAIETVARELAVTDPVAALDLARSLGGDLRHEMLDAVLEQWSLIDPAEVIAYLTPVDQAREFVGAWDSRSEWAETLAAAAPELVLEAAASIRGPLGRELGMLAIRAIAATDPAKAAAIAAASVDRADRDDYAIAVSGIFAARDPDAAIEWLRSMEAPHQGAIATLVATIAETDAERVVDLVLTDPMFRSAQLDLRLFAEAGLSSSATHRLADRIAGNRDHPLAQSLLAPLLSAWAESDLDAAVTWALENEQPPQAMLFPGGSLPTIGAFSEGRMELATIAGSVARRDPEAAFRFAEKLPEARREEWLRSVALRVAVSGDPDAAAGLLEPYRGQPAYDSIQRQVDAVSDLTNLIMHQAD